MGLSIYEPKGDKYSRLFGLENSSCTIDFKWFNWEKVSDNEIVLYGLVKEINSRVYKKDDKDYECKDELVKVSLHEKEYEAYKKKVKPKCHESFFFWFLSNLEKGYHSGSLKFSTELDSVYNQIRKKELVGGIEDDAVLNIVANIQKTTLENEPEKLNTAGYSGGGKTYTPKWKTIVQSFPDYFREQDIKSLEDVIDSCSDDFLYQKSRHGANYSNPPSRERVIKSITVFGLATDNHMPVKDLILLNDRLKRNESKKEEAEETVSNDETTPKDKVFEFNFEGTVSVINAYYKALNIDTEERKALLKRLYGKTNLLTLTDEELQGLEKILEEDLNAQ